MKSVIKIQTIADCLYGQNIAATRNTLTLPQRGTEQSIDLTYRLPVLEHIQHTYE